MTVSFIRTDEPTLMHEFALNLFVTDFVDYVDTHGSAFIVGPHLALTARHNVEIFFENYSSAKRSGAAIPAGRLIAVQSWLEPRATIVHVVRKCFAAPWTDLAVLTLAPANDPPTQVPASYEPRRALLDLHAPPVGSRIAAFGFDDVQLTKSDGALDVRARASTSTGVVTEWLPGTPGASRHGWPEFQTSARFDAGMSGGPVVSEDGLICGVVSSSFAATSDHPEHVSFVPMLWPAMAIEINDYLPNREGLVTLLELAELGFIAARGHERVALRRDATGRVCGIAFSA